MLSVKNCCQLTPEKTIVGVVEIIHQHSLKASIEPIVLLLDERGEDGYYLLN